MSYALQTLWYERQRYLPGILAVAFSGMLIAMQVGILMGLIGVVSVPIVNSRAQIWVMYPNTPSCDLAQPIPRYWIDRLWMQPEIALVDQYIQRFTYWKTSGSSTELIIVVGCNVNETSLGPITQLTAVQRDLLTEPGSVILDRKDAHRLQIDRIGQWGEVSGQQVRVVDFTSNMSSLSGPYVLCSLPTARTILRLRDDQTTFLLATCHEKKNVKKVIGHLDDSIGKSSAYQKVSVHGAEEFSTRSKVHWLIKTKAGMAIGFAALLGLAVGASITSQTLYAATAAALKELAVLRALGIPRFRMKLFVLQQSLLVGLFGLAVGGLLTFCLASLVRWLGTPVVLSPWLLFGTAVVTLSMALISGLLALRCLRQVEPALLLR